MPKHFLKCDLVKTTPFDKEPFYDIFFAKVKLNNVESNKTKKIKPIDNNGRLKIAARTPRMAIIK